MGHIIRVALQPQDRQPRPMPNIDYITVKGFKSIASIENLNLRALNVLIGPNGSGKSNFLEVFSLLKAIRVTGDPPIPADLCVVSTVSEALDGCRCGKGDRTRRYSQ